MDEADRFRGCLLGLAAGDAVGTTVEFQPRGSFPPVTDMVGGGPFGLKPGEWTDDTSMALCLAHSLLETNHFDPIDQMTRYCKWWNDGYMSSNGRCFDIGNTVSALSYLRHSFLCLFVFFVAVSVSWCMRAHTLLISRNDIQTGCAS